MTDVGGLKNYAVPHVIGQTHVLDDQLVLHLLVRLRTDHVAYCFKKNVNLGECGSGNEEDDGSQQSKTKM